MAISTLTLVIGYQVVELKGYVFTAVALIIPFRYLICDIIAEVYGFQNAKKIIIYMIFGGLIFSLLAVCIIKLPAPSYWINKKAYVFVLGNTLSVMLYATLGVFIGSLLNIHLVSRWKVFAKGRFFWLRSLGGSCIGEFAQYAIGLSLMFHAFLSFDKVFHLVITDYLIQVVLLFIFSPIAQFFMFLLKNHEGIEENNYTIDMDNS